MLGQVAIPVPVLGAIIGNAVGMMLYQAGTDCLSEQDNKLLFRYSEDLKKYQQKMLAEYDALFEQLNSNMRAYMLLLNEAYSPDVDQALEGAIRLARVLGVAEDQILDSDEKFESYFWG